jgi:hypothetical protein
MKRLVVPALALALAACASSSPPPAHTPPSAAIVAMVQPSNVLHTDKLSEGPTAKPQPLVTEHVHTHWSITVPTSWKVNKDTDEGLDAISDTKIGMAPVAVSVMTGPVSADMAPEAYAVATSIMAPPAMVPKGQEIESLERHMITFNNVPASVTTVITKQGIGLGICALEQETTHTGYILICVAAASPEAGKLCAGIHKTFKLR